MYGDTSWSASSRRNIGAWSLYTMHIGCPGHHLDTRRLSSLSQFRGLHQFSPFTSSKARKFRRGIGPPLSLALCSLMVAYRNVCGVEGAGSPEARHVMRRLRRHSWSIGEPFCLSM